MTDADENLILKSQLKDLKDSYGDSKDNDPQADILEFNKEM